MLWTVKRQFARWSVAALLAASSFSPATASSQVNSTEGNALIFQVNSTEYARISGTGGNVGIGTANPLAKLTVAGDISSAGVVQVSGSSLTCSSAVKGAMRYSNTSSTLEYCNSTAWTSLGPSDTTPVSFRAIKASQTGSANVATKLTWSESFDSNNNFAADRFTASVKGTYYFTSGFRCDGGFSGYCQIYLYKNGAFYSSNYIYSSSDGTPIEISDLVQLNVGDYVESYGLISNASGTPTFGGGGSYGYFSGVIIGPQVAASGGGSSPAGSTGDLQFNNAGALSADTGQLYWDATNNQLGIGNNNPAYALEVSGDLASRWAVSMNRLFGTQFSTTYELGMRLLEGTRETRIISKAADSTGLISFYTGVAPSERMRIDSNGNVGIGTAQPSEKLTITSGRILVSGTNYTLNPSGAVLGQYNATTGYVQAPSGGNFQIWKDDTTAIATFTESGNVGIGTTTPSRSLVIQGNSDGLRIETASGPTNYYSEIISNYLSTEPGYYQIGSQKVVGLKKLATISAETYLSNFYGLSFVTGALDPTLATVRMFIAQDGKVGVGTTSATSTLQVSGTFTVSSTITNATPALFVNTSGNVSIGTASPNFQLDVRGSGQIGVSGSTAGLYLYDRSLGLGQTALYRTANFTHLWDSSVGNQFSINNTTGNVGINNSTPANAKLDVVGGATRAIYATNTGGAEAIYGYNSGANFGLRAYSESSHGLYTDAGTNGYGVYALAGSTAGYAGVIGYNSAATTYGQLGKNDGYGIYCVGTYCGGSVAWTPASDARLKEDVQELDGPSVLAKIDELRPVTYHWRDAALDRAKGRQYGFIAQEVRTVFPEMVIPGEASMTIVLKNGKKLLVSNSLAMDYSGLVVPAIKAIQALKAANDNQSKQIEALQQEIKLLRNAVE